MTTPSGYGGFIDWLAKPENQLLLAGAGQKLDPTGVGGALGGATSAYLQSNIAADRADKQEAQHSQQAKMVTDVLARMADPNSANLLTPKGTPGATGIKTNNDGSLRIDADVGPGSTANQQATQQAKSPAVSPAGAALLNSGTNQNPIALPATTVTAQREPAVPAAPVAQADTPDPYVKPAAKPFDIRSIIPFF